MASTKIENRLRVDRLADWVQARSRSPSGGPSGFERNGMRYVRHFWRGPAAAFLVLAGLTAASASASAAAPVAVPYEVLTGDDFQSFLGNWEGDGPLCAALASQADWDRYMHPAATMGRPRHPFQPEDGFWRDHVALLIGRVANAGGAENPSLRIEGVTRQDGALTIATRFRQPAHGSYQMKLWAFVVLPRPLPDRATFRDADGTSCAVTRLARRGSG
jgi:hypothetical protein